MEVSSESPYIALTTSCIPSSKQMSEDSKIPIAAIIAPFLPNESPLPQVVFHESIIRCKDCLSYINPYVTFEEVCQYWRCNICSALNPTPSWYMAPIDDQGKRTDLNKRPELTHNSYDIIATEDYMTRPPMPAVYYFVIDISASSHDADFLDTICDTIQSLITKKSFPGMPRTLVGLLAFDTDLHFVSLDPNQDQPMVYTVAGTFEEVFLPVPYQSLLVPLEECSDLLTSALDLIRTLHSTPFGVGFRSAVMAAYQVLYNQGGKALFFLSDCLIESGHPKDLKLDMDNPYYKEQAHNMSSMHISCDLFATCSQFCNVQTLSELSWHTGGDVYFYSPFRGKSSMEKLRNEINIAVTKDICWEAAFRLRTNKEFKAETVYGHFSVKSRDLLCFPTFNYHQTIVYEFHIHGTDPLQSMQMQTAMLYSSSEGERKVRVHNIRVDIAKTIHDVLNHANSDALINFFSKRALQEMVHADRLNLGREFLETRCKEIALVCVRNLGKMPKNLEGFTFGIQGMMKSFLFANQYLGYNTNLDLFQFYRRKLETLGISGTKIFSCPYLFQVKPNEPATPIGLSSKNIDPEGVYLLDTGVEMLLWIGKDVNSDYLQDLVGMEKFDLSKMYQELELKDENLMEFINSQRGSCGVYQSLTIILNGDSREQSFFSKLVEDRTLLPISYQEFYQKVFGFV
ncbi:unnamed protein product [Blepharisma stoltei]|uniref:Uncharacterized protein n=1 Tax=Blepharisma stoltei TaxID=1481888 RepID=A0AAU9IQZ6_9CILI|nr:unnamed protein product [Blepharisma stoltei]